MNFISKNKSISHRCVKPSIAAIFASLLLTGCATSNIPLNVEQQIAALSAKKEASTRTYNHSKTEVLVAASNVFNSMHNKFYISVADYGMLATRSWSTYLVLANMVGVDYWIVKVTETDSGTVVFVNAVVQQSGRNAFEMAVPEGSGPVTDIPLSPQSGLSIVEMNLFHEKLKAQLEGTGTGPSCEDAFGANKGNYPLTCKRGGVTHYF